MSQRILFILTVSIQVSLFCGYLEYVNVKAGSVLPREDIDGEGNDSWRAPFVTDEKRWRMSKFKNFRDDYATFTLTKEQREEMLQQTASARTQILLRDLAELSLILYLLIPIMLMVNLMMALSMEKQKDKVYSVLSLVLFSGSYYYLYSREIATALFAG